MYSDSLTVYIHVCMYIDVNIYTCKYIYMYVYIHVCKYVCTRTCKYVYKHILADTRLDLHTCLKSLILDHTMPILVQTRSYSLILA